MVCDVFNDPSIMSDPYTIYERADKLPDIKMIHINSNDIWQLESNVVSRVIISKEHKVKIGDYVLFREKQISKFDPTKIKSFLVKITSINNNVTGLKDDYISVSVIRLDTVIGNIGG